ncbi:MAG: hypothetical protein P8I90_03480, partial [Glaciecola sp.]|nr:hypothetical protein [Glaciecola sp.]
QFSIVPRDIATLPYIMTAPWLHISIAHFWSNCLTFVILSFLLLEFGFVSGLFLAYQFRQSK